MKKIYNVVETNGEMYYIVGIKRKNVVSLRKKENKEELYEPFGKTLLVDSKDSTIDDEMTYYITNCNKNIVSFEEIFVENMEDVM